MKISFTIPDDAAEAVELAARETGLRPSEWARSTVVKSAFSAQRQRQRRRPEDE